MGWLRSLFRMEPPRVCAENGKPLGVATLDQHCRHSLHCYVDGIGYEPCNLRTPIYGRQVNGGAVLSFCQHGRSVWVC